MRALLINPKDKTITEVALGDDYEEVYDLIDCRPSPFTLVQLDQRHVLYADDEGLFKKPTHFTVWHGYPHPLAGKLLIAGVNAEGDTADATYAVAYVWKMIEFKRKRVLGFRDSQSEGDVLGARGMIFKRETVFEDLE